MKKAFLLAVVLLPLLVQAQYYRLAVYEGTGSTPDCILGSGRHIRLVLENGARIDGKISAVTDSTFDCDGKTISPRVVKSVSYRGRTRAGDALLVAGAFMAALGGVTVADERNLTTPEDKAIDHKIETAVFPAAAVLIGAGLYLRLHWVIRPLQPSGKDPGGWRLGIIRIDLPKQKEAS